MMDDLSAAAAALIETLPSDVEALSADHYGDLAEMTLRLGEAKFERLHLLGRTVAPVRARSRSSQDTLFSLATTHERAEIEQAQRLYLDAERAIAALVGWEQRSGLHIITTFPDIDVEPTMIEDADGAIQFVLADGGTA